MFDVFFSGMSAFSQVTALIGGGICALIGIVILGNGWYWRLKAERVEGTITGVRQKGQFYYSVYQYMLSDGRTFEATSDTGTNSLKGRETGSRVKLYVFPDDPEKVRQSGFLFFNIIGLCFLAPGAFFIRMAFVMYPVTPMTFAVLAAMIAYGAFRFSKHIIPKDQRLAPEEWRAARKAERKKELGPARPVEDILDSPEVQQQMIKQRSQNRKAAPLLLVLGFAVLAGGVWYAQKTQNLLDRGLRAPGEVVRVESSSDSDNRTSYFPVVTFTDAHGRSVTFRDSVGSSPPSYRAGDKVTAVYLAGAPQASAQIDRGAWNWLPAGALLLFGGLLVFAGFKTLPGRDDTV